VEVRRTRFAGQQLARPESTLRSQHDRPLARLDHYGLVSWGVTWSRYEANTVEDLFVAVHEPEPVGRDRSPIGDCVSRSLSFAVLGRLDEDRRVERPLLSAVIEMEMRENHRGESAGSSRTDSSAS
jgi:hypothetical protein